jgi:hypothetical protein
MPLFRTLLLTLWLCITGIAFGQGGGAGSGCGLGEILQNDTSICNGTTLDLLVRASNANGSSCFLPQVKSEGNLNLSYASTTSDAQRNVFLSGAFSGSINTGGFTLNSQGGTDFFLIKYDSCGSVQWAISGGSAGNEDFSAAQFGKGIATDAAGNVFLAGRYNQACTLTGTNGTSFLAPYTVSPGYPNHQDGFLVKLDPTGKILWGITVRGPGNDGINAVAVDALGNPVVSADFNDCCPTANAGTVYSTGNTVNIPSINSNSGTGAIIKFNPAGNTLWVARIYNREVAVGSLASDAGGNIYATGYFRSWNRGVAAQVVDGFNTGSTIFNPGFGLGYLVKLNPNGSLGWATSFGNSGTSSTSLTFGTGLAINTLQDVWVSGFYSGASPKFYNSTSGSITGPNSNGERGFVVKYSNSGQALALNTFQPASGNPTRFIGIASLGTNLMVCGNVRSGNNQPSEVLVARYDQSAVQQTVYTSGGTGNDMAYDIKPYGSRYLIAGSADAGADIGASNLPATGSWLWLADQNLAPLPTVQWSTGATTAAIQVTPTQTTTYTVTLSDGIITCTDSITVTVTPGSTAYYTDLDGDGYGGSLLGYYCIAPATGTAVGGDCNDANPSIYPGAIELCNNLDDDCDGQPDNGLTTVVGNIQGNPVQCIPLAGGTATFFIPTVNGATSYFWNVPFGVTIAGGQGTNTITIAWVTSVAHLGINGALSVTVTGACGATTIEIDLNLHIQTPVRPSSISGPSRLCPGDTAVYSVLAVARANEYTWSMPQGLNILSGDGTNIITATADLTYGGGAMSVTASNACGTSPARNKNMFVRVPTSPLYISGPAAGVCGASTVVYTTPIVTDALSYFWTVPAGVQLLSGQSSNTITVTFDPTFVSGNIGVSITNKCGVSLPRTLNVRSIPDVPGPIAGPLQACPGSNTSVYSVATVFGATAYNWTVFSGASILSGQGTKAIKVVMPSSPVLGQTIRVTSSNACGVSNASILSGIDVDFTYCLRQAQHSTKPSISLWPNPTRGILNLRAEGNAPAQLELYSLLGSRLLSSPWNTELDLSRFPAGLYLLRLRYADGKTDVKRVEVN